MEAQAFKHEDVKMVLWLCQGERSDMSWKSLRVRHSFKAVMGEVESMCVD